MVVPVAAGAAQENVSMRPQRTNLQAVSLHRMQQRYNRVINVTALAQQTLENTALLTGW